MAYSRSRMSEWYWEGGRNRRLAVGLLATAIALGIFYLAKSPAQPWLVGWLIGFHFGAWSMERLYIERRARRPAVAG